MSIAIPPRLIDEKFFDFCQAHPDLRIERNSDGELIVMPATGGETSSRNSNLTGALNAWSRQNGSGVSFDSSGGFYLPNGAMRSPDASWIGNSRLKELTKEQRQRFLPLCPDFVVELLSSSDSLAAIQEKMQEYIDNGARLGWLLDPAQSRVYVCRPNQAVEILNNSSQLSGDPVLPGFVLDLKIIWDPGF